MRISFSLISVMALISLAACTVGIGVSQILVGGEVNDRQEIIADTREFSASQEAIHIHAFMTNVERQTEVVGAWWHVTSNQKFYESRTSVTSDAPVAKFVLQSTQPWPVGEYRFTVTADGKEVGEAVFEVRE